MMRTIRIVNLYLINIFQHRLRAFIWFSISLINPLLLLLYWNGTKQITPQITTYYLLLIIAGSTLMSYVEESVGDLDIKQGGLVKFLLKPYSYYWIKLFDEGTFRITQGIFGILSFSIVVVLLHPHLSISKNIWVILLTIIIWILASFIAFTYKMILGLAAFWITDSRGLFNISELSILMFAGYLIPLFFAPYPLQVISNLLPFAYIVYYPIIALSNQLNIQSLFIVIGVQLVWLVIFWRGYTFIWKKGVKKFAGVGQ